MALVQYDQGIKRPQYPSLSRFDLYIDVDSKCQVRSAKAHSIITKYPFYVTDVKFKSV